jgi:hypothetical protein
VIALLLVLGCAAVDSGGAGLAEAETGGDPCEGVPVLTWNNWGAGFMIENCQGCHASTVTGERRQHAPTDIVFDTPALVWEWSTAILDVATGEDAVMPPQGGVSEIDRARLGWWLQCGVEGT